MPTPFSDPGLAISSVVVSVVGGNVSRICVVPTSAHPALPFGTVVWMTYVAAWRARLLSTMSAPGLCTVIGPHAAPLHAGGVYEIRARTWSIQAAPVPLQASALIATPKFR
ncbi:MAG TPA: hypothetical protein VNO26_10525 [Candidatus Limnocylindria bacterium]|nr:hypothetical protein [Candidatus Limnocylindria bacterium]